MQGLPAEMGDLNIISGLGGNNLVAYGACQNLCPSDSELASAPERATVKRLIGYEALLTMSKNQSSAQQSTVLKTFTPYKQKKGEEYMSEGQRDHFKTILRDWRSQLMEEVDRTVHHLQDDAANYPDPADRATQEEEFSLELRTRDRERKLIKKIDSTIEKIAQNDYGYCESCGIEIGIRRLEARPTADKCIDCKTLDEIREKQWGA